MANLSQAREVDLHNFRLLEAELKVCDSIEEAWCEGLEALLFIHGYHNGVAIKSFIRKPSGLKAKLQKNFPEIQLVEIRPKDEGCTYVIFGDRSNA